MSTKLKVSVIIPTYNCAQYLTAAVKSVLEQTYTNYEIILVDDGSTDNTRQVLEPYWDKVNYVYQDNQGVAAARNRGLELATGELIAFLDHDDLYLPDKLALQVKCFEENPNIGMVHTGWQRINHLGEFLGDVEPWHNAPNLDLLEWLQWMPILLSAMMFRQPWLQKVGGLDTQFKQACDLDLIQRLALQGCQTAWVRQITVCYREHDRNDSLNTLLQAKESVEVREKFFQQPDLPAKVRRMESNCLYQTYVWIAWRLFYTGYTKEMFEHLEKSLDYTPYSGSKTIYDWINFFKTYAQEYSCDFDVYALSNSEDWKNLINRVFQVNSIVSN